MKITFLLPHMKVSGGVRVVFMYADLLQKMGHEVVIAIPQRNILKRFIRNFLFARKSWLSFQGKILQVKEFSNTRLPPSDVIVASGWQAADALMKAKGISGEKFYFIQHDERLYHGNAMQVENVYRSPLKKIVVSTWLKNVLKDEFQESSELLLNSVDTSLFYPRDIQKDARVLRVLILHHNYEWKGTKEGVEVIEALKERYPHMRLILFGARKVDIDTPHDEYYYDASQNELAKLYSGCDIFLCPSWDEGFGLPSLEAMACRCAVVTYDNGGSRDFAFHEKTALVAKRKDKDDLMQQLERLVVDENLRRTITENGYQFVQNMSTWEEQAKKLEDIFIKEIQHA